MSRFSERPTTHELIVLRAMTEHSTMRDAAAALCISPHTVDAHLDHLRAKTGLHSIAQLVGWAARNGWLYDDKEASAE